MKTITKNERAKYTTYKDVCKFNSPEEEYAWASTQVKPCSKCGLFKPLTEYNFNTSGRDPFDKNGIRLRRPECSDCTKNDGKTKTTAKRLYKKAHGTDKAPEGQVCEICGETKNLVFDHDHMTAEHRGWLCDPCNRSIGLMTRGYTSDMDGILNVIKYLLSKEKDKEKSLSDINEKLSKM